MTTNSFNISTVTFRDPKKDILSPTVLVNITVGEQLKRIQARVIVVVTGDAQMFLSNAVMCFKNKSKKNKPKRERSFRTSFTAEGIHNLVQVQAQYGL